MTLHQALSITTQAGVTLFTGGSRVCGSLGKLQELPRTPLGTLIESD